MNLIRSLLNDIDKNEKNITLFFLHDIWFNSNEKALIHPNSILKFIWPCFIHCMSLLYVCTNLRQQNSLRFALPFENKLLFSDNKLQTVNMTVLVKCKN